MPAHNAKWNTETILAEVSKYETLTQWHAGGGASYNAARRLGIFDKCAALLKPKTNAPIPQELKATHRKEQCARYYQKRRAHVIATVTAYTMRMYNTCPLFKLKHNLRRRTRLAFKAMSLNKPTSAKFLGANWIEVKQHLESKFPLGMTWDNYGAEWHIDHIQPLFKATDSKQLEILCHYTNLQPLWITEHRIKSAKERGV